MMIIEGSEKPRKYVPVSTYQIPRKDGCLHFLTLFFSRGTLLSCRCYFVMVIFILLRTKILGGGSFGEGKLFEWGVFPASHTGFFEKHSLVSLISAIILTIESEAQ